MRLSDAFVDEFQNIDSELGMRFAVKIHHVTRRIVGELNVVAKLGWQIHVVSCIFGGEEGCGEVKNAVGKQNLHVWVCDHCAAQVWGCVWVPQLVFSLPPPVFVGVHVEDLVVVR